MQNTEIINIKSVYLEVQKKVKEFIIHNTNIKYQDWLKKGIIIWYIKWNEVVKKKRNEE